METLSIILDWIIKPAVGALALWIWTISRNRYRDHKFRKEHSVAGKYLAYSEGERAGQPVKDKELLEVNQSITHLNGMARTVDSRRQWNIEAEIVDFGYLSGSYRSAIHTDKSRGTFFLEPEVGVKGEYDGFWAGYDALNRMVKSGKYCWRKLLEPRILPLKDDLRVTQKALAILAVSLGKKYINEADFRGYLGDQHSKFAIGAIIEQEPIAVALAEIMEKPSLESYQASARKAGFNIFLSAYQRVGHLRSIAVKDEYRRQGVGTTLCSNVIEVLRDAGCNAVFTVAWEPGLTQSSMSMFETLGFARIGEVPEFWKVDEVNEDHQCPRCGFPCTCTAIFCLRTQL